MELPPYPDAGEPCINPAPMILVAVCVNGIRQPPEWTYASEVFNIVDPPMRMVQGGCGGKCPKVALLELAREAKWSAEDTIKALKALG